MYFLVYLCTHFIDTNSLFGVITKQKSEVKFSTRNILLICIPENKYLYALHMFRGSITTALH